jgi:hypothetical protein
VRFSTRQRPQMQYNEEEYDMYGLESDDEDMLTPISQPVVEEDEGDVIEAVLDHRRRHGTGMCLPYTSSKVIIH